MQMALDKLTETADPSRANFLRLVRSNLEIRVAQRQVLDLALEIGDVQQTVSVTSEATRKALRKPKPNWPISRAASSGARTPRFSLVSRV